MKRIACEVCGSNDLIKRDGYFQCEYCGTKYSTEEVRKLIGTVEITKGEAEKERLLNNADGFVKIGAFDSADKVYHQIAEEYPCDYIGWAKLAEFPFIKANKTGKDPSITSLIQCIEYERRAKLYNNNYSINDKWDGLINKHGKKLRIIKELELSKHNFYETILDQFDADLICCDSGKLNSYLAKLQSDLTNEYCKRLLDGELGLFQTNRAWDGSEPWRLSNIWGDDCISHSYIDNDLPYNNKTMNELFKQGKQLGESLRGSFSAVLTDKKRFLSEVFESTVSYPEAVFIMFVIGKNVIYSCYDSIYVKRLKVPITQQSLNTVLQRYNINLYSSDDKSKAETFIKNFVTIQHPTAKT